MPKIVPLPGRSTAPPRKRRGRDHEAVLAAYAVTDTDRDLPPRGMPGQPHMSYNEAQEYRTELARKLMPWAQARVGTEPFTGYYTN